MQEWIDARRRRHLSHSQVQMARELGLKPATMHEGLPVTTVAKSVMHVLNETGRLGLARQAIKDARKEGYISAAEANRLMRQLNRHPRAGGRVQGAKELLQHERKARRTSGKDSPRPLRREGPPPHPGYPWTKARGRETTVCWFSVKWRVGEPR
jgi:hypothetical protein